MASETEHDVETYEGKDRNFLLYCVYLVLLRVGWIFKTESIVMPAVVDLMGGGGWMRGFLPMFNRFGQSIPPLLAAPRIRNQRIKKFSLAGATAVMGACFLFLSAVWTVPGILGNAWLPTIFLSAYAIFFASVGINQLSSGTLTGKLIPVRRRGRLILVSTVIGSASAILCAWFVMRPLVESETGRFDLVFLWTGSTFLIASILLLFLKEPAVAFHGKKGVRGFTAIFKAAGTALKEDRNFRLLAIVAAMFGMSVTLFPHYQSLARGSLKLPLSALIPWVIAQNLGAGCFSIPAGSFADSRGNKLVLRWSLFVLFLIPLLSLGIAGSGTAGNQFWFVFLLLGLTPVTMRTFNNYTLEITAADRHPEYLSILGLCMAGPAIFTSILLGGAIQVFGYTPAFLFVSLIQFLAWLLSGRLVEPRQ